MLEMKDKHRGCKFILKHHNLNFISKKEETDDVFDLNWFTNAFYLQVASPSLYHFWQKIFIIIETESHQDTKSHRNEAMMYHCSPLVRNQTYVNS